jgi:three-Cys-motif partner protein
MITKHGTYIDGFGGPQEPGRDDLWAANLVLNSEPRWLRNFFLFDSDPDAVERLRELKGRQPARPKRRISVYEGDFNQEILPVLAGGEIKRKEASFCLLDQRTFECKWRTLTALAEYKSPKIELFYFLGNLWLDRALAAVRGGTIGEWWGREDWERLKPMRQPDRMRLFATRFREELGYASVKGWPIMERQDGGHVMYYMIHATDHAHAPLLMQRAYERVLQRREPPEQVRLELGLHETT